VYRNTFILVFYKVVFLFYFSLFENDTVFVLKHVRIFLISNLVSFYVSVLMVNLRGFKR
jgi:hypothetical protein